MLRVTAGYEVTRPTVLHSTFCVLEFDHVGSPVVLSQIETASRRNCRNAHLQHTHIDLIRCYKIIFGLVCVNADDFLSFV